METILTKKNCHRAATVLPVNHTDGQEPVQFNYRAIRKNMGMFSCRFTHTVTSPNGDAIEVSDYDLKEWIVVSWKYEENLEDLYHDGVRAYSNTSHTPEERALRDIYEYEEEIQKDLKILPESYRSDYFNQYKERVRQLFYKHSGIASAMIVGPARFPAARMERANNAYNSMFQDFRKWRENFFKKVEREKEAAKSPEQKADEAWEKVKRDIMSTVGSLWAIDLQNAPYSRPLFVSNLYGKMETLAKNGKVDLLRRAGELIKELNVKAKEKGAKEIFTSRHKFWKLVEKAEETIAKQAENANRENEEFELEGCTVVKNYAENRLQIFHEEKPAPEVISLLKKEAWKWSRNNVCWQHQLTRNACYSAARVILGGPNGLSNTEEVTKLAKKLWDGHQE